MRSEIQPSWLFWTADDAGRNLLVAHGAPSGIVYTCNELAAIVRANPNARSLMLFRECKHLFGGRILATQHCDEQRLCQPCANDALHANSQGKLTQIIRHRRRETEGRRKGFIARTCNPTLQFAPTSVGTCCQKPKPSMSAKTDLRSDRVARGDRTIGMMGTGRLCRLSMSPGGSKPASGGHFKTSHSEVSSS